MKQIFYLLLAFIALGSCKKDDNDPDYRSEVASYVVNIITNGEPITGANITYIYSTYNKETFATKNYNNTKSIADYLENSPTYTLILDDNIRGEVKFSIAASSSSDNAQLIVQLVRNGTIIKEKKVSGKILSAELTN